MECRWHLQPFVSISFYIKRAIVLIEETNKGVQEKMLKTVRKRKHLLFSLTTVIVTFSLLFGGFVVGGPALADEGVEEPEPGQTETEEPETEEPELEETETEEPELEETETEEPELEETETEESELEETETEEPELEETETEEEEPDEDGDGVSDVDEEKLDREVQVFRADNRVKIESERKTDTTMDEFKTEIEEIEGLRIKYEYNSEAGSEESEVELVIQFIQLIEYTDIDNDGLDIIATYPLEGFTYEINDLESSTDSEILHEIIATSANGVFVVRILAPEGFTVLDGIQIEPTTLKIDIEIHEFQYAEETSHLALETQVETSASDIDRLMEGEELVGVSTTIGGYSAEFTWVSTVMVDEKEYPVGVEIFEEESSEESLELKLFLLYPQGESIVHDPKLGTPLNSLSYAQGIQVVAPRLVVPEKLKGIIPPISRGYIFFGSLLATVFVVSVPVILRKRKV